MMMIYMGATRSLDDSCSRKKTPCLKKCSGKRGSWCRSRGCRDTSGNCPTKNMNGGTQAWNQLLSFLWHIRICLATWRKRFAIQPVLFNEGHFTQKMRHSISIRLQIDKAAHRILQMDAVATSAPTEHQNKKWCCWFESARSLSRGDPEEAAAETRKTGKYESIWLRRKNSCVGKGRGKRENGSDIQSEQQKQ